MFSGGQLRVIEPLNSSDNGLRWHVRAYDRERSRFGNFVLTHTSKVEEFDGAIGDCESLNADEQWACIVEMDLVPHPGVAHPAAIETDYG